KLDTPHLDKLDTPHIDKLDTPHIDRLTATYLGTSTGSTQADSLRFTWRQTGRLPSAGSGHRRASQCSVFVIGELNWWLAKGHRQWMAQVGKIRLCLILLTRHCRLWMLLLRMKARHLSLFTSAWKINSFINLCLK
ncbi:MAG: hypothetical protein PHN50_09120, partial [Bacteroidales bacterium]|nr:hypothetical protein [Bacteroidales bacterium]